MNAWQDKDPLVRAAYELKQGLTDLGEGINNCGVLLALAWIITTVINQTGCS